MRLGFWLPWWLLPAYALVWLFLVMPIRVVLAAARSAQQRRRRRRQVLRVRVRVRTDENAPAQPEG